MKRADLTRALLELERIRMDSYEAAHHGEALRLQREYDALWNRIRPFCIGETPCSDDPQPPSEPR